MQRRARCGHWPSVSAIVAIVGVMVGCGESTPTTPTSQNVKLSASAPTVVIGGTVKVFAAIPGASSGGAPGTFVWSVNGVVGGDPLDGRIDAAGTYTAPMSVPDSNPVRIAVSASTGAQPLATVSIGVSPVPAIGHWSITQPRVVNSASTDQIVFLTNALPGTTRVQLAPPDGGAPVTLTPLGGTLFQGSIPARRVLASYGVGQLHAFVGFLDEFAGDVRNVRGNLFANVRDAGVPAISLTPLAPDAQRSAHIVNIRFDSLFLGGGIPDSVARRFYRLLGDDYDFLGVVEQADVYANRNYQSVSNAESGFGVQRFDNTARVGSHGRLLGMIDYPISGFFDLAEKAALHEIGHRWMAYVPGMSSGPHWAVSDVAYGVMGFSLAGGEGGDFPFTLTPIAGGGFSVRAAPNATHYNDLELYLMGLAPPAEVGPHFVFQNQDQQTELHDGGTLVGPVRTFSVDDVIAAVGPRVPAFGQARTAFSYATIVLSAGRLLTPDELSFFDHMAARGEATTPLPYTSGFAFGTTLPFALATNGRGQLSTAIR
jgi:hypothetical protein